MSVQNEAACSPQFNAAMKALDAGDTARRTEWPAGTYLRKQGERIAVYRNNKLCAPAWLGPSSVESSAEDWQSF